VAQWALEHGQAPGAHLVVTVLFSDVRQFTPFASQASPERVVGALNEVFSRQIDAIQKEGGTLNKFIGDGLMAFFGAPIPLPPAEQARAAARAALAAQSAVEELAASPGAAGLHIGIGINTGEVVAGFLGTKDRTEYSVIGHPVNLASRLEGVATPGEILLGPETARLLDGDFRLSKPDFFDLPGIPEKVSAVQLLGKKES
jgi:adenylate cyclase